MSKQLGSAILVVIFGVLLAIHLSRSRSPRAPIPQTPTAPKAPGSPESAPPPPRIHKDADAANATLTYRVDPVYPPVAQQARIQGAVRFHALIGADGSVQQLQLISGHPLLVRAASDAVRQWKYQPTLVNGKPVEVQTEAEVLFALPAPK